MTKIFIKNLDKTIDTKALHDTFSAFGNILSCKVAQDNHGQSKGYGFVHFETKEAANMSIEKVNGMLLIGGKKVFVERFIPRKEPQSESSHGVNLYVKNLDDSIDDERLCEEFKRFGTITSAKVMLEDGRSKGFGFVCFTSREEATRAILKMDGRICGSKPLHVTFFQRREDRKFTLATQYMQGMSLSGQQKKGVRKPGGKNVFVNNLDKAIDNKGLREMFSACGNILSCNALLDGTGQCKGYGFVHFETAEAANMAIKKSIDKTLDDKNVFVRRFIPGVYRRRMKLEGELSDSLRSMFPDLMYRASNTVLHGGKSGPLRIRTVSKNN